MIRIGNAIINEQEIAAVYPSLNTDGKSIIALKSGRTVWVMETVPQIVKALEPAFGEIMSSKLAQEIEVLTRLLCAGYHYIYRDLDGELLYASDTEPQKSSTFWALPDNATTTQLDELLFDGVVEWNDRSPTDIETLLDDMAMHPERYEE